MLRQIGFPKKLIGRLIAAYVLAAQLLDQPVQSVSQWAVELGEKGRAGLKKAGRAGRKPRLSAEDLGKIEQGLQRGPGTLGYETSLWTTSRVAHLIEQECGVSYPPSQAWRILRQLGWSCQRPTGRAWEGDEDKIRRWKQKRWAELKKRPKTKAAPSSSSTRAD